MFSPLKVRSKNYSTYNSFDFFQNPEADSHVRVRGLEINGNLISYKNGEVQEYSDNLSQEDTMGNIVTSDSPIIPLGAVHSSIGSPFSNLFLNTNYIVSISLLSLTLLISISVCGVFRYLRMHEGDAFQAQERAGTLQAGVNYWIEQ